MFLWNTSNGWKIALQSVPQVTMQCFKWQWIWHFPEESDTVLC